MMNSLPEIDDQCNKHFDKITVNNMSKLARYECSFVFAVETQLLQKISEEITLCFLKRHKTEKMNLNFLSWAEVCFPFQYLRRIKYFLLDRTLVTT